MPAALAKDAPLRRLTSLRRFRRTHGDLLIDFGSVIGLRMGRITSRPGHDAELCHAPEVIIRVAQYRFSGVRENPNQQTPLSLRERVGG